MLDNQRSVALRTAVRDPPTEQTTAVGTEDRMGLIELETLVLILTIVFVVPRDRANYL